jgi:hypothetical protein
VSEIGYTTDKRGDRIEIITVYPGGKEPRPKTRKPFVIDYVQFPEWWIDALRGASGSAHTLAEIILREDYKIERSRYPGKIVLTDAVTQMPHSTRRRALEELVERGLIAIEQGVRQAAIVTKVSRQRVMPENG